MTKTFTPRQPIWCAGCGHFGVQAALVDALRALEIPPHETLIIAGIGCSGTIQNNIGAYGYHAIHGRVLPTAIGAVVANPGLTVIASGGDGDGYAIGLGHLIHTFRRNPSLLYVVMNNGIYGLTKGQPSPTSEPEVDSSEQPLDAVHLGLTIPSSTFIARGFVGKPVQLGRLMREALVHVRERRGFAFLEVMSPCVTYNDSYSRWDSLVIDLDEDTTHDASDWIGSAARYARLIADGRIPTGLIYRGTARTYEAALGLDPRKPMALQDPAPGPRRRELEALLEPYYR